MKRSIYRCLLIMAALVLMTAGCNKQPEAETQGSSEPQSTRAEQNSATATAAAPTKEPIPPENLLFIACDGDYPIMPFILTMDYNTGNIRFINFYLSTQINAVTKDGSEVSMPMTFLSHCETPEIVKAYENTYGITIDRYIIFKYDTEKTIEILNKLGPIKLIIPEEFLGDEEHSSINGNMQYYGESLDMEPKPVDGAGEHELDSLGLFSFFHTIPERVWESERPLYQRDGRL